MTLTKNPSSYELTKSIVSKVHKTPLNAREEFTSSYDSNKLFPRFHIPNESSDSHLIFKYVTEELSLDGNPTLNLASFVNTELSEPARALINDNLVKNLADNDEYPSLIEFQGRCISMISSLWHAPQHYDEQLRREVPATVGTATTGSSEAIMLAGLALKKSWQERQRQAGKSTENPNILMATCAQVALEKFARYFDVENRLIEISAESGHVIDVKKIKENIDENTIGIFVIMGSTFTGAFEPVLEINNLLDEVEKETGVDVKIHVDGASGGFTAPFTHPNLKWDFSVDRVVSINTSGHKFGLTTAGLGWVIWKNIKYLPENLRFKLDYLGGIEETFNLNFSRAGFPVIHQYYNFLTLGREGYTKLFDNCMNNARVLSLFLEECSYFEVLSVIHKPAIPGSYKLDKIDDTNFHEQYQPGLPVVAFRFSKDFTKKYPEIPQNILSLLLRNKGFIVPNYHLPPGEQSKEILRVVVKSSLSLNLLEKLMQDILSSVELLISSCDSVRNLIAAKDKGKLDHKVVYDLLLSVASNGVEELKGHQKKFHAAKSGHSPHKNSYRGAC